MESVYTEFAKSIRKYGVIFEFGNWLFNTMQFERGPQYLSKGSDLINLPLSTAFPAKEDKDLDDADGVKFEVMFVC